MELVDRSYLSQPPTTAAFPDDGSFANDTSLADDSSFADDGCVVRAHAIAPTRFARDVRNRRAALLTGLSDENDELRRRWTPEYLAAHAAAGSEVTVKRAYVLAQTGGKKRPMHPRHGAREPPGPTLGEYLRAYLASTSADGDGGDQGPLFDFRGDELGLGDKPYLFDFNGWFEASDGARALAAELRTREADEVLTLARGGDAG